MPKTSITYEAKYILISQQVTLIWLKVNRFISKIHIFKVLVQIIDSNQNFCTFFQDCRNPSKISEQKLCILSSFFVHSNIYNHYFLSIYSVYRFYVSSLLYCTCYQYFINITLNNRYELELISFQKLVSNILSNFIRYWVHHFVYRSQLEKLSKLNHNTK